MKVSELPAPSPCRTCGGSGKACERMRELRGRPCCERCGHPEEPQLEPGSESW